jgi:hypothetical protein
VLILKDLWKEDCGQVPAKRGVCSEVLILKDLPEKFGPKTKNASKMLALSNRIFL